jgi:protoporphyrinogen oxidase
MNLAILGAGVSGLSLARSLSEGGFDPANFTLFEAAPIPGGLCRSRTVDGFTYDIAGGHILYSKDAEVMDWMKAEAGGPSAFVSCQRNTRIRFEDRWVHYPFENGLGDLPPQANFDCLAGYIQAWHERSASNSSAPDDFGTWIYWRFGKGIAEHFMNPYNEKIWKRPLTEISSDWVAGRVPDAPVEDVIRSAIGIRTEGYTHQSTFSYPLNGGFQAITDGMAGRVADRIRLNTRVESLRRMPSGWEVNAESFDLVVSTLPLDCLPPLLAEIPEDIAQAMQTLEFNGLVTFLLALDRSEQPDLSWIYLPHEVQGPANRVTYISGYSPNNAPQGKTSLLVEVTCRGRAPVPGQNLEKEVLAGLESAGLISQSEVLFTDRSEVSHAYVVFDHDYNARREAIFRWMDEVDLIPLGRFGRYEYDNSDLCVIKARSLATQILARADRG